VAVGAKKTQVLDPIVGVIPVDVVQVKRKRLAAPLGQVALETLVLQESFLEESSFQVPGAVGTVFDQDLVKRSFWAAGMGGPTGVRLAKHVGGIQPKALDVYLEGLVASSTRNKPQFPTDPSDASVVADSSLELRIGP